MSFRKFLIGMCGVSVLAAGPAGLALASEVIYDSSGFIRGQQSGLESFSLSGPGTLTVTLANVNWPQQLASLNLVVSSASGLLGPEMGAGTESYQVTEGGEIFAQWFGTAQGPLDTGTYTVDIAFQPNASLVPLPTSIALLASGLAVIGWHRRRRRSVSEPQSLTA
jgi:hypothetical protein